MEITPLALQAGSIWIQQQKILPQIMSQLEEWEKP
jgi:hypothetical protein